MSEDRIRRARADALDAALEGDVVPPREELEAVDRLLAAAGPMAIPSADLVARVLSLPDLGGEPAERPQAAAPAPPPVAPPAPVRERRGGVRTWWGNLTLWRVAATGFAAAAVVLAVVAVSGSGSRVSGRTVALQSPAGAGASGAATFAAERGSVSRIRVRIDGLPPVAKGFYELWLARDPAHRVSIGVFRPDANGSIDATVDVPTLGPLWRGVWLTREPGDGHPGWSQSWVVKGKLV